MPNLEIAGILNRASNADVAYLAAQNKWHNDARNEQILPLSGWSTILAMAGRGWGY